MLYSAREGGQYGRGNEGGDVEMKIGIQSTGQHSCILTIDGEIHKLKSLSLCSNAPYWVGETEDGGKLVIKFEPEVK